MINFRQAPGHLRELRAAYRENAVQAISDNGVSRPRQLLEMVGLRVGSGKLTPEDYYRMRVYRRDLTFSEKQRFISQGVADKLGSAYWIIAHDKLVTQALLEKQGVRTARIRAVCHPVRSYGDVPALRTAEALRRHLFDDAAYPFVAKPVTGIFSRDVTLVEAIDRQAGVLRLAEGRTMPVAAFAEQCLATRDGTLLQERLLPHPRIAEEISARVCTLRLIVLVEPDRVRLYRALWKIAANGNVADNYWRPGNLMARLDPETGTVVEAVSGLGPRFRVVERAPATGKPLAGFSVPHYAEAVAVTLAVARVFANIKMQAWDIAVTPDGPVPLEVNVVGSVFLPQLVDRRGMNDPEFQAYFARARS